MEEEICSGLKVIFLSGSKRAIFIDDVGRFNTGAYGERLTFEFSQVATRENAVLLTF